MPITSLRYQKNENVTSERELMRGYFREIIHSHGQDALYLKKDIRFFDQALRSKSNLTYGEDPTAKYNVSKEMVIFIEQSQDNMFLSHFGFETDGSSTAYIMIDDFYEAFRDEVGTPNSLINPSIITLTGAIVEGEFEALHPVNEGSNLQGDMVFTRSGISTDLVNDPISSTFRRTPVPHNPFIKSTLYYTEQSTFNVALDADGGYEGTVSTTVDIDGNGIYIIEIPATQELLYWTNNMDGTGNRWEVAPVVGDIIRMDFYSGDGTTNFEGLNNEEYEITKVTDNDKTTGGLNPLLDTYIWKCSIVRRDPSHEDIPATTVQEEPFTPVQSLANLFSEEAADEVFDYENEAIDEFDGEDSDEVYGGYDLAQETKDKIETHTDNSSDNDIYGGF